ncbi:hypothetical protein [Escherichia phage rV5_ev146]|uniref:Uncharacterized protein n=1 Tax=Escherichia phage rV5_ev146 TaxID=2695844 RepID=A0A653HBQ1_9CAUD|nr:hypothetical protein [Escherichia phage rV5_ev146]
MKNYAIVILYVCLYSGVNCWLVDYSICQAGPFVVGKEETKRKGL